MLFYRKSIPKTIDYKREMLKENASNSSPLVKSKWNFSYLPDYANFLLQNELNEFVISSLRISREEQLPLLKLLDTLPEKELLELSLQSTIELLEHLAKNKALEYIDLNMDKWVANQLPVIQSEDIVSEDITGFSYVRRKIFRNFLSKYTSKLEDYVNIMDEVDRFVSFQEEISFRMLLKLKQQKINDHLFFIEKINNTSPGIIYIFDMLENKEIYSNHKTELFTILENETTKTRIIQAKDEPRMSKHYKDFLSAKDGEVRTIEYEVKNDTNPSRWLRSYETVFKRALNGEPLHIIGIALDITKNHLLNEQLKENEKTFRQLIDNAPDAVIVIDESSKILLWNPKATEIFGWSAEEALKKTLTETIIPSKYTEKYLNDIYRFKTTGEAHVMNKTIEIMAVNKREEEFFIALSIATSMWNGKSVFISFIRDISKEKKIGMELEKNRNQLTQKNAELERMNNELVSFSYVAGHDLKEPLRKIRTFSNFIIEKSANTLSDEVRGYMERIITSTSNMQKLIDDLLAFSRTGSSEKILHNVNLNTLLSDVKNLLKERIEEKGVTITATHLPTIKAIHFQFQQLLENIISNAIKYSKPDVKPQITITAGVVSGKEHIHHGANPEKAYNKISISDNGIGFEEEYAEKIFELFQRLHGKDEYSGTGIGLAICKKIVENHNGFIVAEGKEGIGSTFNIYIPME